MVYYIYKITNKINKKFYIGKTNNLRLRMNTHRSKCLSQDSKQKYALPKLYNAMRKWGIENFAIEPLMVCENEKDTYLVENFLINKFNTIKKGYNTSVGGLGQSSGFKHSPESIQKISLAHKGELNHFYGKIHSQESKEKMSKSHSISAKKGEDNHLSKLTNDQVFEIRRLYSNKIKGPKQISQDMKIPLGTIKDIVSNKSWRHLL